LQTLAKPETHFHTRLLSVATRTVAASAAPIRSLSMRNGDDVGGNRVEAEVLKQILGLAIDV